MRLTVTFTSPLLKLWGTKLFDSKKVKGETQNYIKNANPYGCPLDSRSDCTKSDWYDSATSLQNGFRHRSVQGGLFIKLL